jgi:hypothetical protein
MAHWESPAEQGCSKGTNRGSWLFWPKISSVWKSQRDCGLPRKSFHTSWSVWRTPWKAGGKYCPRYTRNWGHSPPEKIRPGDLKLKNARGIDGIPNECLRHLPRRPLVHLIHTFNHCLRLSYFPSSWKEAEMTLPKSGKDPKSLQNLRPISLLPTTGKLFEKVIQKIVQNHTDTSNLLNASQFGFRARHSTTLQCTGVPIGSDGFQTYFVRQRVAWERKKVPL